MAWYYGTFACGHEGRVNIIGPVKDRQWKADNRFSGLCPECYAKALQERREKENAEAAEKAKEMELPELQGTPKQIAWANTLRQKRLEEFEELSQKGEQELNYIQGEHGISTEDIENTKEYMMKEKNKATYYIDLREYTIYYIIKGLKKEIDSIEKKKENEAIIEDLRVEATVYPEKRITNSIVEISTIGNTIKAKFEKNSTFIEIVKSLGYKWEGVWQREITEYSGPIEDRIVELGNELLNKGFPVMILDPELRERAIKGEYTPEQTRWIKIRGTGDYKGWLSISWNGRNKELYEKARLIAGSRYSSPAVVVKVEHYREVEDFAETFGFKFSEKAQKAIEEYKEAEKNILVVKPKEIEKEEEKDKLQDILDSGTDILDDLKD